MGNTPREDDSSWSLTSVDSKILKWSPNVVKWPVRNRSIKIEMNFFSFIIQIF